ncbi:hypothetical protein KEM52_005576 [Ascosphaera acerosa]|nr:hypothetical protein KEM52_005576 [Ascosphaera acerosa]
MGVLAHLVYAALLFSGTYGSNAGQGCKALRRSHTHELFMRQSEVYDYEQSQFWSNTERLDPACGANNIDDGVLIVMSNITELSLSQDRKSVSVGPSHRWVEVYDYLQQFNLSVPGGRLAPVGVPGLLLAGGVNFYGNQVGWSANSVINYEVVLANGTVVSANSSNNADLFWALKGGSSNFGLVTRFDIETVPSTQIWGGSVTVGADGIDDLLQASAQFAANISDPKTHIVPAVVPAREGTPASAAAILFYDSDTESHPEALQMFTDLNLTSSSMGFKTIGQFARENAVTVIPDINDIFVAGTVKGKTYEELHKGLSIVNQTFTAATSELFARVPQENLALVEVNFQPIGTLWTKATNQRGGNPLGLDEDQVYLCYAEVVMWQGAEYDDIVNSWVEETTYKINNATQKVGLYDAFNYMGDAAGFQNIYDGFSLENKNRLQQIARRYDPHGTFQKLMPGGFKLF